MMKGYVAGKGGPISQNDFRQLIYFRGTTDGRRWTPSDLPTSDEQWTVPDTSRRWRMYQAREFHAYAIDSIWSWLVDWGIERGGAGRPPKTNDVITALIKSLDFDRLANALGISRMSISTETTIQDAQRKLRVLGGEPDIAPTSDESWIDRPYGGATVPSMGQPYNCPSGRTCRSVRWCHSRLSHQGRTRHHQRMRSENWIRLPVRIDRIRLCTVWKTGQQRRAARTRCCRLRRIPNGATSTRRPLGLPGP